MPTPELKPKKGEILRAWIQFIFGFENKKGEVLDSWITFFDSFSFPPKDFYALIEQEMESRKAPKMTVSRLEFAEGGMISNRRTYLRLFRERLAIYTCAAPFGTGYFFSCRVVYVPALVRLWHLIVVGAFLSVLSNQLQKPLGFTFGCIALATFVFACGCVMQKASSSVHGDIDSILLSIPVISTIYEDWFREDTYYRQDTRSVYLTRFPALIRELADEVAAAKGARMVSGYAYAPVLGELYKPLPLAGPRSLS